MAPALSAPSWRHSRSMVSPCSVSAPTSTRVHDRPRAASAANSSSASALARKAAASTRSAGGSSSAVTDRSGGGSTASGGRSSRPVARRWARAPSAPNRAVTSATSRAASSPSVSTPRRPSTAVSSGRSSRCTDSGARKAGVAPGGDERDPRRRHRPGGNGTAPPRRAASAAAKGPSATPMRTPAPRRHRPARRGQHGVDLGQHVPGEGLLAAEVAGRAPGRERDHAGPGQLQAGREGLDGLDHGLEGPGLAAVVALVHDQARAPALGLPPALADGDPRPGGPPASRPPPGWRRARRPGHRAGHRRPAPASRGTTRPWPARPTAHPASAHRLFWARFWVPGTRNRAQNRRIVDGAHPALAVGQPQLGPPDPGGRPPAGHLDHRPAPAQVAVPRPQPLPPRRCRRPGADRPPGPRRHAIPCPPGHRTRRAARAPTPLAGPGDQAPQLGRAHPARRAGQPHQDARRTPPPAPRPRCPSARPAGARSPPAARAPAPASAAAASPIAGRPTSATHDPAADAAATRARARAVAPVGPAVPSGAGSEARPPRTRPPTTVDRPGQAAGEQAGEGRRQGQDLLVGQGHGPHQLGGPAQVGRIGGPAPHGRIGWAARAGTLGAAGGAGRRRRPPPRKPPARRRSRRRGRVGRRPCLASLPNKRSERPGDLLGGGALGDDHFDARAVVDEHRLDRPRAGRRARPPARGAR